MSNRKFEMYQYRQIIIQMRLGQTDRAISKTKLAGRRKLCRLRAIAKEKGWLDTAAAVPDDAELAKEFTAAENSSLLNKTQVSLAKTHDKEIRDWVSQGIGAAVIHHTLVRKHGFKGSYDSIQRYARKIKQERQIYKASCVLDFSPGEAAQVDFGKGPDMIDTLTGQKKPTWIFVMTLCFSRHQYSEVVYHQDIETWLGCHKRAFEWFGGVPSKIIIDNCKCAITKACYYDPVVQRSYAEFAEAYSFIISPCPPREPKKKGRVESGVKFVKNNFVPLREFNSRVDANIQLKEWILSDAGNRIHGTTHQRPLTVFVEIEKHALKPLPVNPPELATWIKVKVHGDCHVQYLKCRYSIPYKFVHKEIWLRVTETNVRAYFNHEMIAIHGRLKKPGSRSSIQEHMPPDAQAYLMRDPVWCRKQAKEVGSDCAQVIEGLFKDKVLDQLRAVQGILGLSKKYGTQRLNAACARALKFNSLHYKSIKQILAGGLDQIPLEKEESINLSGTAYVDGQYCRNVNTLC